MSWPAHFSERYLRREGYYPAVYLAPLLIAAQTIVLRYAEPEAERISPSWRGRVKKGPVFRDGVDAESWAAWRAGYWWYPIIAILAFLYFGGPRSFLDPRPYDHPGTLLGMSLVFAAFAAGILRDVRNLINRRTPGMAMWMPISTAAIARAHQRAAWRAIAAAVAALAGVAVVIEIIGGNFALLELPYRWMPKVEGLPLSAAWLVLAGTALFVGFVVHFILWFAGHLAIIILGVVFLGFTLLDLVLGGDVLLHEPSNFIRYLLVTLAAIALGLIPLLAYWIWSLRLTPPTGHDPDFHRRPLLTSRQDKRRNRVRFTLCILAVLCYDYSLPGDIQEVLESEQMAVAPELAMLAAIHIPIAFLWSLVLLLPYWRMPVWFSAQRHQ